MVVGAGVGGEREGGGKRCRGGGVWVEGLAEGGLVEALDVAVQAGLVTVFGWTDFN